MSTWVPEDQRDTSWYIFNSLFRCRVSNIKTMSKDYLKNFGMPMSGDPFIDKQTANELVDRMLTIEKMAEYFKNGVEIRVLKASDTKIIYDRIRDHLEYWANIMNNSINPGRVSGILEDLQLLDGLASKVYPHAKSYFEKDNEFSPFARLINGGGRSVSTLMGTKAEVVNNDDDGEAAPNPYPSMADTFKRRRAARDTSPSRVVKPWK